MKFPSMKNLLAVAFACCMMRVHGKYTYPHCAEHGKDCCEFGTLSMMNRGYILIAVEGDDMVVTCHKGVLRCSNENPTKKASFEAASNVTCPDFASMMESRSDITYLDGVQEKSDEAVIGTVKAAKVSN